MVFSVNKPVCLKVLCKRFIWQFRNMQEQAVHFLAAFSKLALDGHLILQGARTAKPKRASYMGADGCSLHQTLVVMK